MSSGYYESALLRLRRVTAYLTLRYTDVVKAKDLTPVQFEILLFVGDHGPCSISDIADFMVVDRSTSSRVLRGVESKDLIKMVPDQSDRRKIQVSLTLEGEVAVSSMKLAWLELEKAMRDKYDGAIGILECT
jgi:DNA-binding MarR family transcriptional regulator